MCVDYAKSRKASIRKYMISFGFEVKLGGRGQRGFQRPDPVICINFHGFNEPKIH